MPRRRMIVQGDDDFEELDMHPTPLDKETIREFLPKKKRRHRLLTIPDDEFMPVMEERRLRGQEDV